MEREVVSAWRNEYLTSAWGTAKKKAGIPKGFHFHDLRHTTASWLKMGGADDYTVMEILGHSDIKMMKRSAHLDREVKLKALARPPSGRAKTGATKLPHPAGGTKKGSVLKSRNPLMSLVPKRGVEPLRACAH